MKTKVYFRRFEVIIGWGEEIAETNIELFEQL